MAIERQKAGAAAIVLACMAVAVPLAMARFEFNPAFVLTLKWTVAALFAFVAVVLALASAPAPTSFMLLDLCVLVWQAAVLLSVVFSKYPDHAWMSFSQMLTGGLIYVAVRRLPSADTNSYASGSGTGVPPVKNHGQDAHATLLFGFFTLAATVMAGCSLAQQLGWNPLKMTAEDANQFSATVINRNLLAGFLAMVLPLELHLMFDSASGTGVPPVKNHGQDAHATGLAHAGGVGGDGFARTFVLVLCTAVCIAALALSRTRGAWVGAVAGVLAYFALVALHARGLRKPAKPDCGMGILPMILHGRDARATFSPAGSTSSTAPTNGRRGRIVACAACTLVIAFLLIMLINQCRQEPVDFTGSVRAALHAESKSVRERKFAWNVALDVFSANPVFGSGFGTYCVAGQQFKARHMASLPAAELTLLPRYAHNDSLQLAAETGLVGLVSFLLILLVASCGVTLSLASGQAGSRFLAAAAAGVIVIVAHGIVHFPLYDAPTAVGFWIFLGLIGRRQ